MLYDQTGSWKSNIAASKQELHISGLVDVIEVKFQRLYLSNISGLESAILNSYFRSGRKMFPMGELDKDLYNDVSQAILFAV